MIDTDLPGAEIVILGLEDIRAGRLSAESLALEVVARRLLPLGIDIVASEDAELRLYDLLRNSGHADAYGRYNALLRRLDSFGAALELRQRQQSHSPGRA